MLCGCRRLQLEQLLSDVSASLDKMEGREQQLTGQFQGLLDAYRESRQQHTEMQEDFSRWVCLSAACGCAVTACMRAVGSSWLQHAAFGG